MNVERLYTMTPGQIAQAYEATQIDNYSTKESRFLHTVIYPSGTNHDKTLRDIVDQSDGNLVLVDGVKTNQDGSARILVPIVEGEYIPPRRLEVETTKLFCDGGLDKRSVTKYKKTPEPELNTLYDKYLYKWKGGPWDLRVRVGEDVKELYDIFGQMIRFTLEKIQSDRKLRDIAFARAMATVFLHTKYSAEMTSTNISKILGITSSGVNKALGRFDILELTPDDLNDKKTAFMKCYQAYIPTKPALKSRL